MSIPFCISQYMYHYWAFNKLLWKLNRNVWNLYKPGPTSKPEYDFMIFRNPEPEPKPKFKRLKKIIRITVRYQSWIIENSFQIWTMNLIPFAHENWELI
jgi:hypothetical protein